MLFTYVLVRRPGIIVHAFCVGALGSNVVIAALSLMPWGQKAKKFIHLTDIIIHMYTHTHIHHTCTPHMVRSHSTYRINSSFQISAVLTRN